MHRELVDEQRPHVALLEVARVDPVVGAGDLVAALGVRDDVAVDLEHQLLDAFFLEDLFEPLLRARPLVLDGLGVDVAEAELQEVPDAADVAPGHVADVDQRPRQPSSGPSASPSCAHAPSAAMEPQTRMVLARKPREIRPSHAMQSATAAVRG